MVDILNSQLYLEAQDANILRIEPEYVKKRYFTIAKTVIVASFRITRQQAADILRLSKRHLQRLVRAFRESGIAGLRFKSKRPKNMPQKSPEWIEDLVVEMRQLTGLGGPSVSTLANEKLNLDGQTKSIGPSLAHKILVRNGLLEPPEEDPEYRSFTWKRPNRLIQSDLTEFNTVQLLTMEDDGTRKAWAKVIDDAKAKTVTAGMRELVPHKYDNLLTDNGRQFLETNRHMREYRLDHVTEKHIHASVRHPQTLGKLGAYQKGLKRFLQYKLGDSRNKAIIKPLIRIYNLFYNNGRHHTAIDGIPEVKYSGKREENWFKKMMRTLKSKSYIPFFVRG